MHHRTSLTAVLFAALVAPHALAQPVLITAPQTLNPGAATITPTGGGPPVPLETAEITVRATTLTVNGRHTIRSLVVESNATVTHDAAFSFDYSGGKGTDVVNGLWLNVLASGGTGGDVVVQSGSTINGAARGYPGGQGPGAGDSVQGCCCGGGAGHGGSGASWEHVLGGPTYGSFEYPTLHGSGGGALSANLGGPGGGVVRLVIDATLTLDGTVTADGTGGDNFAGAGSGGSVWLSAASIQGSGSVRANGGVSAQCQRGGGGGRIAINAPSFTFTGTVTAATAAVGGGAGSVYFTINAQDPTLLYDNAGITGLTEVNDPLEFPTPTNIIVRNGARLAHPAGPEHSLLIHTPGNLTIESTGGIDVTARGYPGDQGPGAGGAVQGCCCGGGGGHGGHGAPGVDAPGGSVNDSLEQPTFPGSGGGAFGSNPGGPGGGVVRLIVDNLLTIDGTITAHGTGLTDFVGAGAGGSIWITAANLDGSGTIHAHGGTSAWCQLGGGGGRIAVYACTTGLPSANIAALRGSPQAGDGTVFYDPTALSIRYSGKRPQCRGDSVTMIATAAGATSFQWLHDGVELVDGPTGFGSSISGALTDTLTITNAQANDRGLYTVRANNACGLVTSLALNMTLCIADFNCDGTVNSTDVSDFINQWFQDQIDGTLITDWDANGVVNSTDVSGFINTWFEDTAAGCG